MTPRSPDLQRLRQILDGKRIGIVHYVEHTPLHAGYRAARHGQLARWLTASGAEVTRFVPTFSHFLLDHVPESWTGSTTEEGVIHMVPTRSYTASRDKARIGFIRDFAQGTAAAISELEPFDAFVVGYPPPGVVKAIHGATRGAVPVLADIRDLWPDTLVPSERPAIAAIGAGVGKALAQELRLAAGAVAMSQTMLDRAPASRRRAVIPLGIPEADGRASILADDPMIVTFVGSFSHLFDFDSLFEGWQRFLASRSSDSRPTPELRIFGAGMFEEHVRALAAGADSVMYGGWVDSSEIPQKLAETDIGVSPTRPGQGTTLSNKVLEYLGSGAYVLHTLEPATASQIPLLGTRVDSTPGGWANGFSDIERRLPQLRAARDDRKTESQARFGRSGVEAKWFREIARLLD